MLLVYCANENLFTTIVRLPLSVVLCHSGISWTLRVVLMSFSWEDYTTTADQVFGGHRRITCSSTVPLRPTSPTTGPRSQAPLTWSSGRMGSSWTGVLGWARCTLTVLETLSRRFGMEWECQIVLGKKNFFQRKRKEQIFIVKCIGLNCIHNIIWFAIFQAIIQSIF